MRILSLPVDDGGCGNYRVRQPLRLIKEYTKNEVHIIDVKKDDTMQVYEALKVADIILLRPGAEAGRRELLTKYPEIKAKWVMDIDDNVEIISPYSEHYVDYGTEEIFDKNIDKWLWKNDVNIDIPKNKLKIQSFVAGLSEVDLVTCTTNKLKEYALQYTDKVEVLPNCIDLKMWWKLNTYPNKRLRVGWSGGVSHYEDWYEIKEPLNKLMSEYDFDLYMIGADFKGVIDEKFRDRLKIYDWIPFKGHSYRMMCFNLDIAIIPLANLPFNHYKSSIKWYEMSAMGVPSVVSNILPYKEDIKDNVNALGYKTPKDFYNALKTLLTQSQTRKKIGYTARKWVEKNRDARKFTKTWEKVYSNI